MKLSQTQLHVEEREASEDEHGEVGDQEGSPAVLKAHIREPPNIAEVDREPNDRQEELDLLTPGLPLLTPQQLSAV